MDAPKKKRRRLLPVILFFILLGIIAGIFWTVKHPFVLSPLIDADDKLAVREDTLKQQVKTLVGNEWKDYSVYVVDFTSPFMMGINESTIFTGASVNKVPILTALYAEEKKGNVNFDQIVTLQEDDIQDYGTGSIRYDPPGTTYTVKTLMRLMMQKSDNTAAYLLGNYIINLDTVQKYVNEWGMTQTDMPNNKTSNKDMEILFRLIMGKRITTPALSDEMLDFLKDSDFENRIPGLLPKDAVVYHKIGTGTGTIHDVGVVVYKKKKYYIGILTADATDEDATSKLESEVSKKVFDYMVSN